MDLLVLIAHYGFIQRALLAGATIGILCALLGLFLVLRRLSLIGDGLAHVSFGGVALGLALGWVPLWVALPVAIIASLFVSALAEKARLYGDAAIGIVSSVGIAGGVLLASMSRGFNVDLFSYLFGNILAITPAQAVLSVVAALLLLATVAFFYHDLFALTFDATYAQTLGIRAHAVDRVFFAVTAVTVVLGIQMVGVMLVSSLLVLPAVSALQVARGFRGAMIIAVASSVGSALVGILAAFALDLPPGATIVLISFAIFLVSLAAKKVRLLGQAA